MIKQILNFIKLYKKTSIILSIFLFFILTFIIFRNYFLFQIGNWLVYESDLEKSEIIIVFSGAPSERSLKAAELWKKNWAPKILCTGEVVPEALSILKMNRTEAELSAEILYQQKVDSNAISILKSGTSTKEESEAILEYLLKNNIKSCILVSSKFHTRRIYRIFYGLFKKNNIKLIIQGADSQEFNENKWWKDEQGLIFVNNEYMKILYYFYKY